MEFRILPFRNLPHQPKIFLQFLDNFPSVAQFYPHSPSLAEVKRTAGSIEYPADRRAAVAQILREQNAAFGASAATLANLDRFANGALAVVSGQQVGLFSGPAYAMYKAVSAIQIAHELTRQGVDAVPVFWMATEDHDLDEVRVTHWFHAGRLRHFELPGNGDAGLPVGQIPLGPAVAEMVEQAAGILTGAGDDTLAQTLRQSYAPEETYGSAFGKLFARLFAGQGLILMDPLEGRFHRLGAPILSAAIAQRDELNDALLARGQELDKAGYDAQVKVITRSTLLFKMCGGKRTPIVSANGKFSSAPVTQVAPLHSPGAALPAASPSTAWSREELTEKVSAEPECFSPNALLRPVLQDYLLPTAAYIAGPAEIAYFAQAEVMYRRLLGRMPVTLPRPAFTILDAKAEKLLKRYGLSVEDVWRGSQELRRALETASVPPGLATSFDETLLDTASKLASLKEQILRLDASLAGAVETAQKKIAFQLDKLKRKAGKAEAQKTGLLNAHQEFLESLLYPHKTLQERELCFLPILASWGPDALKQLQSLASSDTLHDHKLLRIP
jgi:bacillithiol synthase